MNNVRRFFFVAGLITALGASTARAQGGVPFPPRCTLPLGVPLVATNGVALDPAGIFTITVLDVSGAPIPNIVVQISFSCPGVRVSDQPPSPTGSVVGCSGGGAAVAKATTNASGVATFDIGGGASALNPGVFRCATVTASGVLLGSLPVSAFDLAGLDGVNATDLSKWLTMFGTGQYFEVGDFTANGLMNANDLSLLLTVLGAGASAAACKTYCP